MTGPRLSRCGEDAAVNAEDARAWRTDGAVRASSGADTPRCAATPPGAEFLQIGGVFGMVAPGRSARNPHRGRQVPQEPVALTTIGRRWTALLGAFATSISSLATRSSTR